MTKVKKREPQPGSARVRSWLYEVINVLIDGIDTEMHLLGKGDLTWRLYGELEYVRPIADYISPSARPILRDFVRANTDAKQYFDRHDELHGMVAQRASAAHAALMEDQRFLQLAEKRLREFHAAHPAAPFLPGGAIPDSQFPELVAENIVNSISELSPNRADREFWREHKDEFLSFRSSAVFTDLSARRQELLQSDKDLVKWLDEKSDDLCQRYDVPAAPFSGSVE